MKYMYDAIRVNSRSMLPFRPLMVAIYLTGSSDIRWTTTEVQEFPAGTEFVRIDQGGQTSPQFEATVFDAEPGAWSIPNAIVATEKCTAERPTIYCDRTDYATIPHTYTKDIWVAAPGLTDAQAIALAATDKRIVAVQNLWANTYDRSVVVDPNWPNKAPVPPPPPVVKEYQYQVERYQPGFGWVLDAPTVTTKTGTKYRIRTNNGVRWSNWTEITP